MNQEIAVIDKQEIDGFRSDGASAIDQAKACALAIKDAATLDTAAKMMLESKARIKRIEERFKQSKADARKAWQNWIDLESELTEPYQRIEREILKPAMVRFSNEQERIRREEEDRLRAEQRRKAEDERLRQAAELERQGEKDAAEELIEAPVEVAPVVIPKAEAPAGISYRDVWKYRVSDESKIPREYLVVDEKKIGAVVRALKSEAKIAGIEVYSEKVVAGRI